MTVRTVTADELEAIAFAHPGSQIHCRFKRDVEIRELIVGGEVFESRIEAVA